MCKWGTVEMVEVTIPADLSYTEKARKKVTDIDKCIAPIVRALEKGGVKMRGSCCGHNKVDGHIHLQDGRVLVIKNNGTEYMANLKAFNKK